ncbi:hypothetical protein PQR33_45270 [Paraburkholderia sediminicola]|uniref:hypothetical protein n=1 Tax=Paraburkholderia sediminicola TaxID=458836 RepID=UPI0038BB2C3E
MRDQFRTPLFLVVLCGAVRLSQAQDVTAQQDAALKRIETTAADICQTVPIEQKNGQVALTANASAKLDGLIGKLVGVGAGVGASTVSNSSSGVLQSDLAKTIEKGNDCKVSVLKTLVPLMVPSFIQPAGGSPPSGGFASVNEVITANGSFKKQGDRWIEYPPYAPGSYFMFTEVSRDPNQIILSDPSRQKPGDTNNPMLVRLPTHGGAVQWSYTNPVIWMDFTFARPALN